MHFLHKGSDVIDVDALDALVDWVEDSPVVTQSILVHDLAEVVHLELIVYLVGEYSPI